MKNTEILIAGFGGQGILFSGKFLAYKGLLEDQQVSWLPSYGPEMRGGTSNCNVILSDTPVGSPIITAPNVLIAMNLPSLEKYVNGAGFEVSDLQDTGAIRDVLDAFLEDAGVDSEALNQAISESTIANAVLGIYYSAPEEPAEEPQVEEPTIPDTGYNG